MAHLNVGLSPSKNHLLLEPFLAKNKIAKIARAVRSISMPELYQPKTICLSQTISNQPSKTRLAGIEPATYCLGWGKHILKSR